MPVKIFCHKCGALVLQIFDFNGMTLERILEEDVKGRRCHNCGYRFIGKLAGPITIKALERR